MRDQELFSVQLFERSVVIVQKELNIQIAVVHKLCLNLDRLLPPVLRADDRDGHVWPAVLIGYDRAQYVTYYVLVDEFFSSND